MDDDLAKDMTLASTSDGLSFAPSPRPHPVDVGSSPIPGNGGIGTGRSGGGVSIGDVIGVIGAVVIRGGTVDGDHCDPHGGRGRVNDRIPGGILRGRF